MFHTRATLCLTLLMATSALPVAAEQWRLETGYDLPRRAALLPIKAYSGPVIAQPLSSAPLFFGATASHSQTLKADAVTGDFTAELWLVDHVNQPVGVLMSVGDARFGYYDRTAAFGGTDKLETYKMRDKAFKGRWHHLVLVREGKTLRLYNNGTLIGEATANSQGGQVRLDSYLSNEAFMQPANLVHMAGIEPRALNAAEISERFTSHAQRVEDGILYADRFHFTQPPYLNMPQTDSIELSFEFDRVAVAEVAYGETEDTLKVVPLSANARLNGLKLEGLKPDTPYFYRVTAKDAQGGTIDSGLLSFRTAPPAGQPFVMVISGDTEARPHINNRMAELMWEERPALLAIVGDLTDGGSKTNRFEWTHEYFTGMGHFFGRVPVIATPGNGESELHWYNHYHRQPQPESYFSMVYGDVEIFVLDANLDEREKESAGFRERQKAWFDGALKASKSRWKIVMHHQDVRTSDDDDYGNSFRTRSRHGDSDVQADFVPLYEKHNVDLVFFGHLHAYERSWPVRGEKADPKTGITYVQVGGLGGNLEDFAPNKPWFSTKTVRAHHYVSLHVSPEKIEARMVDADGHLRDVFSVLPRNDKR
ncbi:metallophosphoesterase [Asticcacaulis tiandongensis]|uniref:metallophosphoesterase n=1 Tax=Asticcacaulis tiandongensis TaxID=2565365 RepID=UPI0015E86E17|nr:metallophosphoesterase [Asticcacaulis tiandongensis]